MCGVRAGAIVAAAADDDDDDVDGRLKRISTHCARNYTSNRYAESYDTSLIGNSHTSSIPRSFNPANETPPQAVSHS
jgi:hypothetical protein